MDKKKAYIYILSFFVSALYQQLPAQNKKVCSAISGLQLKLKNDSVFRAQFNANQAMVKAKTEQLLNQFKADDVSGTNDVQQIITIPVVVHIVLPNPNIVTAAQIETQIKQLNTDYAGINVDAARLPGAFKALLGKSTMQFCLARRTPTLKPTNGIVRKVSNTIIKNPMNDEDRHKVQQSATGGSEPWNTNQYLNIWVVNFAGNEIGYATFPTADVPEFRGVFVKPTCFGSGGSAEEPYDKGRTLVHEVGHFFNLFHIWGESNDCSDDDNVDDTPNQSNATSGCPTGTFRDECAPGTAGRLYQNYMDYTDDACMVMFTKEQVARIAVSLDMFWPTLKTSKGCEPAEVTAAAKFGVFRLRPTIVTGEDPLTLDWLAEPGKIKFIQIVNMQGQLLYQRILPGATTADTEISTTRFPTGMYYLLVGYDGGDEIKIQAEKFIKKY